MSRRPQGVGRVGQVRRIRPRIALVVAVFLLAAGAPAQTNRIQFNGQDLFLNGLNLAWGEYPGGGFSFADDIGPTASTPNTNHFADVFGQLSANGGNIMRLWLHTTGERSPAWSGSTVTGPGVNTIADLQTILDLAWDNQVGMMLCLWSFDMLVNTRPSSVTDRASDILTNATYRASYINNSLIPMVTALAGHPAIVAWEIFNEPEGMSDEFGWSSTHHVPMAAIQAFVNQCAGAIHRTDPTARVTNGTWSFYAGTDVDGYTNYYRDDRLVAAGGDSAGTLDFYCVHYYDWAGPGQSPFLNPASHWALNKPLVVAEFFPDCNNCTTTPHESLYQGGYAGALSWSWTDTPHSLMLAEINAVAAAHPEDILITDPGVLNPIRLEAEDAAFAGANLSIQSDAAASGGQYLDMAGNQSSDTITWTIPDVPAAGPYDLTIGYRLAYETPKTQLLSINDGSTNSLVFDDPDTVNWLEKTVAVDLAAGSNQVRIQASWGWMHFDYLELLVGAPPPPVIMDGLVVGGHAALWVDGEAGWDHTLATSPNLGNWTAVLTTNLSAPPALLIDTNDYTEPLRFYRVERAP